MEEPSTYSFQRYLTAKRTVDDRALNRPVIQQFTRHMAALAGAEAPVRILEVGAGIGTMIERLMEWNVLPERAVYTAIDVEPANVELALDRLPEWAADRRADCTEAGPRSYYLEGDPHTVTVEWQVGDVFPFARDSTDRSWDVLLGVSFLDLVDVAARLPVLLDLVAPGGLFYFPITFDGSTIFQPTIDPVFDAHVEECYHDTMDRRIIAGNPSGDSQAGRHLFGHVREAGGEVLGAGGSDWVVFGDRDGYPGDEAYFLHHILHMVENALDHNPAVDDEELSAWIDQRRHQLERGELVYVAHQLDLLGRVPL